MIDPAGGSKARPASRTASASASRSSVLGFGSSSSVSLMNSQPRGAERVWAWARQRS
jgi:hypothetical protein